MAQRGGGFRGGGGKYKGRGRQSPYSRGGGGGGGGGYRRVQRSNDGVGGVKKELEDSFQENAPETTDDGMPIPMGRTPLPPGPSPGRTGPADHTPAQQGENQDGGVMKKRHSTRARLFVGNLPKDTSQDTVKELFQPFGEVVEVFVQKEKNFGFVRLVSALSCFASWLAL